MSKDEFKEYFHNVIRTLTAQQDNLKKELEFYESLEKVGSGDTKRRNEIKAQIEQISKLIKLLEKRIEYPAYARIRYMSDEEIEAYRSELIASKREKLDGILALKDKKKTEYGDLKKEFDSIMEQHKQSSDETEKAELVAKAAELLKKIKEYQADYQERKHSLVESDDSDKEVAALEQEIAALESETVEQIRTRLFREHFASLKNDETLESVEESFAIDGPSTSAETPYYLRRFTERTYPSLVALADDEVVDGKSDAIELAALLRSIDELRKKKADIRLRLDLSGLTLPKWIKDILCDSEYAKMALTADKYIDVNADKTEGIKAQLDEIEAFLRENDYLFQLDKAQALTPLQSRLDKAPDYDISFFQRFGGIVPSGPLERLEQLAQKYYRLTDKRFKTGATKEKIDEVLEEYKQLYRKLFLMIIDKYNSVIESLEKLYGTRMRDGFGNYLHLSADRFPYYDNTKPSNYNESVIYQVARYMSEMKKLISEIRSRLSDLSSRLSYQSRPLDEEIDMLTKNVEQIMGKDASKVSIEDADTLLDIAAETEASEIMRDTDEKAQGGKSL